ncbi:MAG: type I-D CRISPR-associated protein Cas5/Csc1 [Anaerolineales bacterium]|nr:type I-D CRISPR-associated protein Cas5/Csc1 [Anaerolineales bacterium]
MWVTQCRLTLHDSLFYATREMGTLYETGRFLHNYALSYALFNEQLIRVPYFSNSYRPDYPNDLGKLNEAGVYVTPARPLQIDYLLLTWKMAQIAHYRKPVPFGARGNFPENFGRAKEIAPESQFEFFVLSQQPIKLPKWIRMGKWASKILVEMVSQSQPHAQKGVFVSTVPLNPLDVQDTLITFDVISMPPISLVNNAHIDGHYYELSKVARVPATLTYTFPESVL